MKKRGEQSRHLGFGEYERLDFRFVENDRVIVTDDQEKEHLLERAEPAGDRTMHDWIFDGRKIGELELFDQDGFRRLGAIAGVGMRLHEIDRDQGKTRVLCEIAGLTLRLSRAE